MLKCVTVAVGLMVAVTEDMVVIGTMVEVVIGTYEVTVVGLGLIVVVTDWMVVIGTMVVVIGT